MSEHKDRPGQGAGDAAGEDKDKAEVETEDKAKVEARDKVEGAGLEAAAADQILAAIRSNEFLAGVVDGRDVSLVYIDRHQVHNYFEREAARPSAPRPADVAPRRQRRIGELVVNPVPSWELERTAAVYVASPLFEEGMRRLREHGLLFLHGPRGSGKRATALRLLSGILFNDARTEIYEINPNLRLTDLRPDDLPTGTALLLESADGAALAGLSRFQLDALCNALDPAGRNNALVVVAGQLPSAFPADYRHLTLEWRLPWAGGDAARQREALVRHIRYLTFYTADYAEVIEPQLQRLEAFPPIAQLLKEALSPGQLAELAALLAPALRGQITVEEAVAGLEDQAARDVEAWFGQGHPRETENLLIAAAVFSGLPYQEIRETARALESHLQPEEADRMADGKAAPRPATRFGGRENRRALLEAIQARTVPTTRRTHYGEVLEDAIELRNPAWQEAVLRFVWEDPEYGGRFLAWLKAYGGHPNHHVRTRAAAAIGALARRGFTTIEADILRAWAASPDPNMRRSAAQVLGITIWDEAFSAPSARLLHYWASQSDQPRWQWTAAAAYAGLAGPRYPGQTLADLKLIGRRSLEHPGLLEPLLRAVLTFYATAQDLPERRLALLEELASWGAEAPSEKKDTLEAVALRRAAALAFWTMLWPEQNDPVWQLLLSDIAAPGAAQNLALELMRRSLAFRLPRRLADDGLHPRRIALDGLRSLIQYVARQRDAEQIAHLEGLLVALVKACRAADPDEVERLRYHAEEWHEALPEAASLLQILRAG